MSPTSFQRLISRPENHRRRDVSLLAPGALCLNAAVGLARQRIGSAAAAAGLPLLSAGRSPALGALARDRIALARGRRNAPSVIATTRRSTARQPAPTRSRAETFYADVQLLRRRVAVVGKQQPVRPSWGEAVFGVISGVGSSYWLSGCFQQPDLSRAHNRTGPTEGIDVAAPIDIPTIRSGLILNANTGRANRVGGDRCAG